ncbi:MAG: hypothetical protein CMB80_21605 [Flammeovirgaceae bacterium]|nr:hypothetical protein [Flammeovirgaceae bacterium]HCX20893.1 hypothetical protein [Cytophagales bacterium]
MTVGYIIAVVCAVWVIYDVVSNQKRMSGGTKALWIIMALIFSVITAIVYFLVVKKK